MPRPNPIATSVLVLALNAATIAQDTGRATGQNTAQDTPRPDQKARQKKPTDVWPHYRGNPALHGVAGGSLADLYELAWSFKTGDAVLSSPVVVDDVVYFGSSDEHVYAVHLATGKKKWSFKTDDMIDAPPLVLDGRVYIGSADFFFYALDAATGKVRWKFETGDKILGGANYARAKDGSIKIIVGSYDSKLYCFDTSGKKLWEYETGNYINGTPAILGDHAVFGGCDAVLHVVSISTGKKAKEVELGADCHVAGSVALADNKVYFGHYGNAFICVDLDNTEEPAWVYSSQRHAFFSSPSVLKDKIIFGGRDKKMHCVSRKHGKPIWTFPTKRKIDGSPVVCGDKVVFGSGDGRLYIVDINTGKEVWKYEIGQAIFSSPAIAKGMILIGSNDGHLYAFKPAAPQKKKSS